MERGYEENILKNQIDKVDNTDRKGLLRKKKKKRVIQSKMAKRLKPIQKTERKM